MIGALDVNLSYNNFVCEFQDLLNKHCPVKRVKNTDNRYANNPWLTKWTKKCMQKEKSAIQNVPVVKDISRRNQI